MTDIRDAAVQDAAEAGRTTAPGPQAPGSAGSAYPAAGSAGSAYQAAGSAGSAYQAAGSAGSAWRAGLAAWRRHQDLLSGASSLVATTGVTSALGFAYWALAARLFSQRSVGYGSAAVSAITLLGTIGMLGLGTVLMGELPRRRPRAGLVCAALLTAGLGSLFLGLGFAVIAPHISGRFTNITGSAGQVILFAAGVALTGMTAVFDQATIGLMRGGLQLSRNIAFSVAKLAALAAAAVVLHDGLGLGITASWVGGMAVSLIPIAIRLRFTGAPLLPAPDWAVLRGLGRTTLAHNWLNLAITVPVTLIPVLITVIVSPSANAAFYTAWMLSSFLYLVPTHLSTVLFAVAAADHQVIARKLRFTLLLSLVIGLPGMAVLGLGAHLGLSMFGASYARAATLPLRLLVLAYLPTIPRVHYIAVCRAAGRVARAAAVMTAAAVLEVAAAVLGAAYGGLKTLSFALLAVFVIEGLVTAPAVFRTAIGHGRHRRGPARDKPAAHPPLWHRPALAQPDGSHDFPGPFNGRMGTVSMSNSEFKMRDDSGRPHGTGQPGTSQAGAAPDGTKQPKVRAQLSEVPETLLWNVYHRALAARGRRPFLSDPMAIELVGRIDYPFAQLRGDTSGQWHAVRVRRFDAEIRQFLAEHPEGTVVALGEGLETQFWRVDNGQARWLTVDLPETVALRRQLLPDGPRQRTLACSATNPQWMDHVDPGHGVMITAQGLLMYFQPAEVDRLVQSCAQRFPGQTLLFDAVPAWMVARVRSGTSRYRGYRPPWVWGISAAQRAHLRMLPGVAVLDELRPARGQGLLFGSVLPALRQIPWLRDYLPEFPVFRASLCAAGVLADHDHSSRG